VSLVLDAGAFLAVERADRDVIALIKHELALRRSPRTHGGVIGQVWRGGSGRQANLARFVPAVDVAPLDVALGRRAGVLLGRTRTADVIDAALVLLAADGDWILTSDPRDIARLAIAAEVHVDVVPV
jgi:hypothetical protein